MRKDANVVLYSLLATAAVLTMTMPGLAEIDPSAIAGLWMLDEGKGKVVEDMSGNGYDGELISDPRWVNGKFERAVEFDGSDDMIDTDYVSDEQNQAFTIMAWIQPTKNIAAQIVVAGRSNGGPQLNLNSAGKAMTGFKMNNGQFAHILGTTTFMPNK
jgi:hypothetical protein